MIKIMFVCHGNICRSTMAEFVMKDIVKKNGCADDFIIYSSATSTEEIGSDTHWGTKKILDEIFFYPPAQHAYQCSICGRACDTACYMHLEEKGVLNKKFNRPFRTREEWKFCIDDFK